MDKAQLKAIELEARNCRWDEVRDKSQPKVIDWATNKWEVRTSGKKVRDKAQPKVIDWEINN